MVALAGGAVTDGADVAAVAAMQREHLLRRGEEVPLQAQRQAQARQAFLETPDQFVEAFGVGQARGQAAAALVEQFQGGVGLLQVEGFVLHLAFQGAMGMLDGFGQGVEAQGQLPQFVLGAVIDPGLVVTLTKAPGGVHQFLQGRDHAVLQFIQPQQQDDQGAEQRQALDQLLPALFVLTLLLQQADELVQLFDKGRCALAKERAVAALDGRAQFLVPVLLDLPVALLQGAVGAVFQYRFQGLAVQAPLQALGDGLDLVGGGMVGEFPAQVVGLHAHRACGVDGRAIALAEPGDQPGAQGTGQGQDRNQDHRDTGPRGQGAAQPVKHHGVIEGGATAAWRHLARKTALNSAIPGALPLKSCRRTLPREKAGTRDQSIDK